MANECVDVRNRSKVPGILCKLDIEKAYDYLNWESVEYTQEDGVWQHLDKMDEVLYDYNEVLCSNQWFTIRLFFL